MRTRFGSSYVRLGRSLAHGPQRKSAGSCGVSGSLRRIVICVPFLLAVALSACSKPTEEKITEFNNGRYKVEVRSREFHDSGIRNVDICVTDINSQVFPSDEGQCFLRGFDFSNLSVRWRSERDVEISFDFGRVTSFRNFAVVSKGQTVPQEFHASLHESCSRASGDSASKGE